MSTPDFRLPPLPGDKVQAEALRVAFPRYRINVISKGGQVYFEAVSKNADDRLYCIISSDAKEVWRELKAAA